MSFRAEPRLLFAPPTKGCAFCEQPAQIQWVGAGEWDQVVVYGCRDHEAQARHRWDELFARFQATLDLDG